MAYNILSRQIYKLQKERWFDLEKARKIAYSQQKKLGRTQEWTFRLNEEWVKYSKYTPAERALLRKAKTWTWNVNDYTYLNWKVKKRWAKNV